MRPSISELAKRLKLSWIREHYDEIEASSNEDYLRILFEKEIEQREERKVNLLLKQVTLPKMSGVPFNWKDVVLTPQLTQSYLLEGLFLEKQENLIFYGGVGTGKTYLSSLISLQLIQQRGLSVKFYTVATLVNKLLEAHEKGTLSKVFKQMEKLDLLVLDELGYIPLHKQGAELLFQVISLCYEKTSIIITSNLTFGEWNHVFGDPILTEAVIDRLIHHSHLVVFNGESHRYKESMIHQ